MAAALPVLWSVVSIITDAAGACGARGQRFDSSQAHHLSAADVGPLASAYAPVRRMRLNGQPASANPLLPAAATTLILTLQSPIVSARIKFRAAAQAHGGGYL